MIEYDLTYQLIKYGRIINPPRYVVWERGGSV